MKKSIRVIARIAVKPDTKNEVRSVFESLIEPTRAEAGCLQYELLQNAADPTEFVLLEEWSNQTALDLHTAASHTKNAEAKVEPYLQQVPPDVRIYQTIA